MEPKIITLLPICFKSLPYIRFIAVAFQSEEEVLWRRNPSLTYFWQIALPWIRPWVEFAENLIHRCVTMSTSSLSSFINIHLMCSNVYINMH